MIRVVVAGATGKTGKEVTKGLLGVDDIEIVGAVGRQRVGIDLGDYLGVGTLGVRINSSLVEVIQTTKPDVLLDFTLPSVAGNNALIALTYGVHPVVGTTGIPEGERKQIEEYCQEHNTSAAIIPNFSLGAMLMFRFAKEAAKVFDKVEIVEKHHETKLDAPSGTAKRLGDFLTQEIQEEIPIHSVRLPGFVAHHEVIFGSLGESLIIKHDTINRESFIKGVALVVKGISKKKGVSYDLEDFV